MKLVLLPLAAADGVGDSAINRFRLWVSSASGLHQALIILGAFFLIALAVFAWAVLIRKPERRRYSRWRRTHHTTQNSAPKVEEAKPRRRRHRKYRARNPSLAEAGGLPPVRNDEPPPPLL